MAARGFRTVSPLIAGAALAIMIAASVFSRRTGIATPLLLVALGIGASYLPPTPAIHVEPELVLAGVLPPLLYASAVQLPVLDIRRNFGLISWLSVVLVIVSALAIGAVVHLVFPAIPFALGAALASVVWFTALGFGARLLGPLFRSPLAWRVLDILIAVTMFAIAVSIVVAR